MLARELESELTKVMKPEFGVEGEENGLIRGDPEREVTHLTFCWTATEAVLRGSVERGAEAVFAHEPWEIPVYRSGGWWDRPARMDLPANQKRNALYEENQLVFYQYHSPLDGWPIWSTGRALVDALGFDLGKADWPSRFIPILDLKPQTVRQLAIRVRDRLAIKGAGISGDPERKVKRVALFVGGFGNCWSVSDVARRAGADVMITGELDDYTVRAAAEADVSVIKASHYSTENPAVKKFAEFMGEELEGRVTCTFLDCEESWHHFGERL